jgi:hypothetical protein
MKNLKFGMQTYQKKFPLFALRSSLMAPLLFAIFLVLAINKPTNAQELNCTVQVLTPQLSGDKHIWETLQKAIYEFMNNTHWTKDNFKSEERIECSILITISDYTNGVCKASIQLQSRRPTYKSSYNSVLMNYNDQSFIFPYVEFQPLEFNETAYLSNLTSVLAYYAYIFIALDYDTFSLYGGTPFYQKATAICSIAQSDQAVQGWNASDNNQKNRYTLVNNMLDPVYAPIREYMYKYHRLGLDVMSINKDQGKTVIVDNLTLLEKAYGDRPSSFSLQLFFNAKCDEMVNLFTGATADEKNKVMAILNEVDPANSNKYLKITAASNTN